VAMLEVQRKLFSATPYWPAQLTLPAVDTYRDPGVVVEVLDTHEQMRYLSTSGNSTRIPISADTARALLTGQPSTWYDTSVDGQHVRVEALLIRAPIVGAGTGPVVGMLLVAKSLNDVDATLLLLRTLLLLSGLATLTGTLLG